jgi:hypothetical protein
MRLGARLFAILAFVLAAAGLPDAATVAGDEPGVVEAGRVAADPGRAAALAAVGRGDGGPSLSLGQGAPREERPAGGTERPGRACMDAPSTGVAPRAATRAAAADAPGIQAWEAAARPRTENAPPQAPARAALARGISPAAPLALRI